ncbi:hypothetical protein LZ32DRAFT_675997, partial [Colletotrichum eremochloae]
MPSLEQLRDRKLITAFVDDITVLVASDSHERNNKALKVIYTLLVCFAKGNGTSFAADKTQIIHLCQGPRAKPFLAMPEIPGLPDAAETVIKILGVFLDYRLSWTDHIAYVRIPHPSQG